MALGTGRTGLVVELEPLGLPSHCLDVLGWELETRGELHFPMDCESKV